MKEPKFRAWDKFNAEMFYSKSLARFFELVDDYIKGGNGIELMQYTGLLDKNGKEIYEGDIVRVTDNLVIVFEWGRVGFQARTVEKPKELDISYLHNIRPSWVHYEILGNIYESPDLLEN